MSTPAWVTWSHADESICWAVAGADFLQCCAWEHGIGGDPSCWYTHQLNYQSCCLERWLVCDRPGRQSIQISGREDGNAFLAWLSSSPEEDRAYTAAASLSASAWELFFAFCGIAQRLADEILVLGLTTAADEASSPCNRDDVAVALYEASQRWRKMHQDLLAEHGGAASSQADMIRAGIATMDLPAWMWSSFEVIHPVQLLTGFSCTAWIQRKHEEALSFAFEVRRNLLSYMFNERTREHLLDSCGSLCNTSSAYLVQQAPLSKELPVCSNLLNGMSARDGMQPERPWLQPFGSGPPPIIPPTLRADFTMNGIARIVGHSEIRRFLGVGPPARIRKPIAAPSSEWEWGPEQIEMLILRAQNGSLAPGPNSLDKVLMMRYVLSDIATGRWLVWTSLKHYDWWKPWCEALLLSLGASEVVSLQPDPARYLRFSPPKQLRVVSPASLDAHEEGRFRGVVANGAGAAGTGRHGEELNPWADLQISARCWCLLEPGGFMLAPEFVLGEDIITWPSGRSYGSHRWPHFAANFELISNIPGVGALLRKPLVFP